MNLFTLTIDKIAIIIVATWWEYHLVAKPLLARYNKRKAVKHEHA
jgi:hypothetical protein